MVRLQRQKIQAALARRAPVLPSHQTSCFRAFHGDAEGLPGVTVDLFGPVAVVSLYGALEASQERLLVEDVAWATGVASVYLKRRPKEARVVSTTSKETVAPEPPSYGPSVEALEVLENGHRYAIRPAQGLSVGLYLDMREPRAWLERRVAGKTVLNCFAYTCAFGVVATAGGARRVVNVDLSRRVLDWGEQNARLNGHAVAKKDYLSGDVFDWLLRFAKKGERFDVVILDPPSFAKGARTVFSAGTDYAELAAAGARVVGPGGLLFACCNLSKLTAARFEERVAAGLAEAGRRAVATERLSPSRLDFPGESRALKVVASFLDGG